MKVTFTLFLLPVFLTLSCTPEPKSKIVQEVEAAGAGDLYRATEVSIVGWFNTRRVFAKKISQECAPMSKKAPANWAQTTEGKTCSAATSFYDAPVVVPAN